jgi:hypothetical protein
MDIRSGRLCRSIGDRAGDGNRFDGGKLQRNIRSVTTGVFSLANSWSRNCEVLAHDAALSAS